jgi:Ni/Fe-hydrogenase subunit HybB-like protein
MTMTTPTYDAGAPARQESFLRFLVDQLKPRGQWLTPFNVVSIPVMLVAAVILVLRFTYGLGAVTNLSQAYPWGIWKAFNVIAGVAFAGGAYVLCFMVYVLGLKKYEPVVRVTVLSGFLAYCFYAGALILELGRPWEIMNPLIGNSFGLSSVLFLVAWHFVLYITAAFLEFSPAVAEWAGARRLRRILKGLTLGAVVLGIALSMLHQSGLGALFLMAGPKIHPLWYSEFIPVLFLTSSIFAGLSVVIVEGSISRRVFNGAMDDEHRRAHRGILLGLSRVCAGALFAYLMMVLIAFVHGHDAAHLGGFYGGWFLLEVLGFAALPAVLFVVALRRESLTLVRVAGVLTLLGVLLNRLNVSLIAFQWEAAVRYVPTWMEVVVALAIVFTQIWVFRWAITRMPVLRRSPEWAEADDALAARG